MKKPEDRYCRFCGAKMVVTPYSTRIEYDFRTGKQKENDEFYVWTCPNKKFGFLGISLDSHDRYDNVPYYDP